jgi:flavorubredoxin
MSMPVHQYLLATEPAVMFATGTASQAAWILPRIEQILGGRPLKYLFVSHMESDECGGYLLFQRKYPKITIICSSFTAHELQGFGYRGRIIVGDPANGINDGELALRFYRYPSEVHLQNGILVLDRGSGVLYSSDLFFRDVTEGKVVEGTWEKAMSAIDRHYMPSDEKLGELVEDLEGADPRFVAAGHGSCLLCVKE